jgi:hypothetical protein
LKKLFQLNSIFGIKQLNDAKQLDNGMKNAIASKEIYRKYPDTKKTQSRIYFADLLFGSGL